MIPRDATSTLRKLAAGFPVVGVTGPRQSGKTTLARAVFSDKSYVSLEDPDVREFASEDPRAFLSRYADGAVLDEAGIASAKPKIATRPGACTTSPLRVPSRLSRLHGWRVWALFWMSFPI